MTTKITIGDKKFWQKYFEVYDVLNSVIPYKEMIDIALEEVGDNSPILDVGTGTGNFLLEAKKKGMDCIGLDYSEEGLNQLLKKDSGVNVINHDISKRLPFNDASFQAVVSINTVFAIPVESQPFSVQEMYRVLKPDGLIVLINIVEGYKPIRVYKKHIKIKLREIGLWRTLLHLSHLAVPTIKMFYYNIQIQKGVTSKDPYTKELQQRLLEKSGFVKISDSEPVLASQAIIHVAHKKS